jgi:hypothetical protein
MTIIVALSLISWAIVITVLTIGISQKNEDCTVAGAVLFIGLMVVHFSFQVGAFWQLCDTVEKYELVKKIIP